MALAKHPEHVMLVYTGRTITTLRPARLPRSTDSLFTVATAASAALRAMVDFARNPGMKSSTAIRWCASTTVLAQIRPSCRFCRAAFFCTLAAYRRARR
ncbi:hypothetical protein [Rhodococcus zopfii]|uniref:hypothetical protein n=1 Tax=Rhodococcus zopfii TaxID=43772 RepID=UPI001EE11535|nr:hypothetical protein [Rhodococcus zopfii]